MLHLTGTTTNPNKKIQNIISSAEDIIAPIFLILDRENAKVIPYESKKQFWKEEVARYYKKN